MKKNTRKLIGIMLALLLSCAAFAACAAPAPEAAPAPAAEPAAPAAEPAPAAPAAEPAPAEDDGKIVIGVSFPQLSADGFSANLIGVEQKAAEYGNIELVVFDCIDESAERQLTHFEDFVTQGVDGIVFIPCDSEAAVAGVKLANEANIPVVSIDRNIAEGASIIGLAESDNYAHGAYAADLLLEVAQQNGLSAGDIKALDLMGAQTTSSGVERHEGYVDRCAELGITIVASLPTEWEQDKAYSAVMDAFQANPDINAIFEASDVAMHAGVEAALTQLGKLAPAGEEGHIMITTVDGGPKGMDSVRAGYIDGMAQQQNLGMSHAAVDMIVQYLNGELTEYKAVQISPVGVTLENVEADDLWPNMIG